MFTRRWIGSQRGNWLAALCGYAIVVAPFGCEFQSLLTDDGPGAETLTTSTTGLFINRSTDDSLLIAGRAESGDAYFVYGSRDADGNLAEIESIFVRQAGGGDSFITFESGRPVHAQAPDGSFVHVVYQEVSATRLTATAEFFNAGEGTREFLTIAVDLEAAAEEIAERVRELTGRLLEVPSVDGAATAKQSQRSAGIVATSAKFLLFVVPLVGLVTVAVAILGQVLNVIFAAISAVAEAVLLAVFSPLFLIAELLNSTIVRVRFVGLGELFDALPPRPVAGGFS